MGLHPINIHFYKPEILKNLKDKDRIFKAHVYADNDYQTLIQITHFDDRIKIIREILIKSIAVLTQNCKSNILILLKTIFKN